MTWKHGEFTNNGFCKLLHNLHPYDLYQSGKERCVVFCLSLCLIGYGWLTNRLNSIVSGWECEALFLLIPSGNLHYHPALSAHISKLRGIKTGTSGIFTELQVGPCQGSFPMQEQAFHFLFVGFFISEMQAEKRHFAWCRTCGDLLQRGIINYSFCSHARPAAGR